MSLDKKPFDDLTEGFKFQVSMTLGHVVRKRCGMVTSGIQHLSAIIFLVGGGPEFYQRIRQGNSPDNDGRYPSAALNIAYYVYYSILIIYSVLLCFADPRSRDEKSVSGLLYLLC